MRAFSIQTPPSDPNGLFLCVCPSSPQTWWTVEARAPDPEADVDATQQRALMILVKIVGMHLGVA